MEWIPLYTLITVLKDQLFETIYYCIHQSITRQMIILDEIRYVEFTNTYKIIQGVRERSSIMSAYFP